ncbi:hypothetical protein [Streptomyces meridianus]|uniref:Uncharacterized protein n=1 Tax=Streptomyces meridianus TaxID=2938945 RepID=A0ABT0X022_9ACTN|nr:hypothetical protein [Streptomyces meridianus]MCM2575873.1 hypothetical protein [Streptomyces meridianus]
MRSVTGRITRSAAVAAATTALLTAVVLPAHAVDDPGIDDTTSLDTGTEPETLPDLDESDEPDDTSVTADPSGSTASATATIIVTPAVVTAGADVVIRIEGCTEKKGVATSEAFVADAHVAASDDGDDVLSAEATVRSTTAPGTYRIHHRDCNAEGSFTVTASASASASTEEIRPTAPVRAGGGGTAAEADPNGPGVAEVAFGLALAGGAAVAVGGTAVRRRRSRASSH